MFKINKQIAAITFLMLIIMISNAFAYVVVEKSKISSEEMKKIAGNKLFNIPDISVSSGKGLLFVVGRDKETREWEWFCIDPVSKKLVKSGKCPFVGILGNGISPDANDAFAVSRFKTALYHLDITSGKWNMLYKNPKMGEAGMALRFFSKINFLDNNSFITILEFWNKKHMVMDSVLSFFNSGSKEPEKITTINTLRDETAKVVGIDTKENIYFNDSFLYGKDKSSVFILRSQSRKNKGVIKDYLFRMSPQKTVKMIDKADGIIIPLFYCSESNTILFSKAPKKAEALVLMQNDEKKELATEAFQIGKVGKNGLISIGKIEPKQKISIYTGKPGEKFQKVKTLEGVSRVFFLNKGDAFITTGDHSLSYYEIEER